MPSGPFCSPSTSPGSASIRAPATSWCTCTSRHTGGRRRAACGRRRAPDSRCSSRLPRRSAARGRSSCGWRRWPRSDSCWRRCSRGGSCPSRTRAQALRWRACRRRRSRTRRRSRPSMTAGTLLAGAALCAVSARESPRAGAVLGGAAMLAVLPWLGVLFAVPALPVAVALYVWSRRARRPLLGLLGAELIGASLVVYATLNERLYGGPTPWSATPPGETATGASTLVDYVERDPAAGHAVGRSRCRPAALGAGLRARVLRRLAAVALAARAPRPRRAGAGDGGGGGGPRADDLRGASCWSPRSSCRRSPATGSPARHLAPALPVGGRARRLGAAARAARRRRARGGHAGGERLGDGRLSSAPRSG